jgi:hypothetical protein
MIGTYILAITDKYAIGSILCLASIPCLIIALGAYTKGILAGAGINFVLFVAVLFCGSTSSSSGSDYEYIANESQTKWLNKRMANINDPDSTYVITKGEIGDKVLFIPAEEMEIVDGWYVMKTTGQRATDDDYYIYNIVYPSINVPVSAGGDGIPQWVYHPAAPVWIFGFFSIPAIVLGSIINRALS